MNYIWDYLIKSLNKGTEPESIDFKKAEDYSPYMELAFHDINFTDIAEPTEVNPWYRDTYTAMFKYIFAPDLYDASELRDQFFDILLHLLFEVDRYQGMSHREYYIRFVIREIKAGLYGQGVARKFVAFPLSEQIKMANGLLSLHRTGESMYVLRKVLLEIFPDALLFSNTRESNDLFFWLRTDKTEVKQDKIDVIVELFKPFRFEHEIYWDPIFGVQEYGAYMYQEEFLQF